jgi:hypothetical protein
MSGMEIPVAGVGFEALDAFLSSNDAPPESMQLSDLDGFLTVSGALSPRCQRRLNFPEKCRTKNPWLAGYR